MALNKAFYLAVTMALFTIATSLGPLSLTAPTTLFVGAVLYLLTGIFAILTVVAPTTLQKVSTPLLGQLITGAGLIAIGLSLIAQGTTYLNAGNILPAGAAFIAGAILIIVGVAVPGGFAKKLLTEEA